MERDQNIILSICIATYNRKELLLELLESILQYPHEDIEIIVSDNASTDGTWEAILEIADKEKRLRVYRNKQNYGAQYNWIRSLLYGTGKYLMMCNDRQIVSADSVAEFTAAFHNIEADAVVAFVAEQNDGMNMRDYENRRCLCCKLGEPGAIIYSHNITRLYEQKHGNQITKENCISSTARYQDLALNSDNWYWYGKTLFIGRSDESIVNVKVERKSPGYVFTGYPKGQLAACKVALRTVTVIDQSNKTPYIKGTVKAFANTLIWTTINSYKSPARCARYNYTPPKHTFWFKEICVWGWELRKCLIELGCYNKEIGKYLRERLAIEYKHLIERTICDYRLVKILVHIKHKFLGIH